MTVDYEPKSSRKAVGSDGADLTPEAEEHEDIAHQVKEHSFGNHSFEGQNPEEESKAEVSQTHASVKNSSQNLRQQQQQYTYGYEDRIQSIADAISDELAEIYRKDPPEQYAPRYTEPSVYHEPYVNHEQETAEEQLETLPEFVQEELQSLMNAAVKVGDVIRHFHEVANKTNLFALKVTSDAMRAENGGTDLAMQVKDLAEETYISAEKIYSCMYSIQQTIVSIADHRFEEYKHLPIDESSFEVDTPEREDGEYKALDAINPKILKSLVDELNKLKNTGETNNQYNDLGQFANQLNSEIEQLKKQLNAS